MSGIDNEGLRLNPHVDEYGQVHHVTCVVDHAPGSPCQVRIQAGDDGRLVDRVAVGGPLHGRVIRTPLGATHILTAVASEPIEVPLPEVVEGAPERVSDPQWHALSGVVTYVSRDRGRTRLLIEVDTLASGDRAGKSNRLGETIVDALGIASGAHGTGGPLVKMLPPPDFDD